MAIPPLTKRLPKGSPLTATEGDGNWQTIEDAFNGLNSKVGLVLNADGTLKHPTTLYAEGDGLVNAYTADFTPAPTSLASTVDQVLKIQIPITNTGPSTINLNSIGPKNILKKHDQALEAGDLEAGQIISLAYSVDEDAFQLQSEVAKDGITQVSIRGSSASLVVTNASASPTSRMTVTAREMILKRSSDGMAMVASGVNVTGDITASGAGGLDVGTEAASTWYYVHVISNGTTTAALFSLSATTPTLPTGYDYYALAGQVFNDSSFNFFTSYQVGNVVYLNDANVFNTKAATAANTFQMLSGADATTFASLVPPNAVEVFGSAGSITANASAFTIAGDANALGAVTIVGQDTSGFNGFTASGYYKVPIKTAQNIFWKSINTSARNTLNVSGYVI